MQSPFEKDAEGTLIIGEYDGPIEAPDWLKKMTPDEQLACFEAEVNRAAEEMKKDKLLKAQKK